MPTTGRSGKLYQERKNIYTEGTRRGPGFNVYLPDNEVHNLKLEAPLPLPGILLDKAAPDNTLTQIWPHGNTGQE
jgi:hypothetical protein